MSDTVDRGNNRTLVIAWVLVAVHVALAWYSRNPGISWGEDDASYIVLGRELLEGHYAERWDVQAPVHARYPPAFPAMLAIANALLGDRLAVYTGLVLLCSAASIALFFDAARRQFGDAIALFATGLTAINTMAITEASTIMAEAPFRFWLTLALWSASRANPSRGHLVLAGVSAVIAALTRSVGVAIIAALALHWMLERRWKPVMLLAVGSVPVALWFYWTFSAPDPDQRDLYLYTILNTSVPDQPSTGFSTLRHMAGGVVLYARTLIPAALSFFGLKSNPIDNVVWAVLALMTLPLGAWLAWKRWRFLTLIVLLYGLALIVWPWPFERFVSPISAMLYTMIGAGVLHLAKRWSAREQGLALAAVALLFVAGSAQAGLPTLRAMMACDRSRTHESPTCFSEDRRGLLKVARYARENTPSDAVFFVAKEAGFYWHTDRQTVRTEGYHRVPADSLGSALRQSGVTYAVLSPVGANRRAHNRSIARACREFETVATFEGDAVLLRLRPGPIDHDDETCQLIAEWKDGVPARWIP